jgi:hypothetical protein
MMADPPAWLLADGRVVLEQHGAAVAMLALEAALRADRRNGRAPRRDLVVLASVLAAAVPRLAAQLPEVQQCRSMACAEAGLVPEAPVDRFWVTVPEVARLCGITERGVRWACTAGHLRARRTPAGTWAIDPASIAVWRSRRGRTAALHR